MGGLRRIFEGMSAIMAAEEATLASKIEEMVNDESVDANAAGAAGNDLAIDGSEGQQVEGGFNEVTVEDSGDSATEGLATARLIGLQYDVQRFSIFNNITTNTMQSVAGAYQGITGNLNFR